MSTKTRTNPITNQYFSVLDGGHQYRVCRHWDHVLLVGIKRRRKRGLTEILEAERLLNHNTRRFRQILAIAEGDL